MEERDDTPGLRAFEYADNSSNLSANDERPYATIEDKEESPLGEYKDERP